MHDLTNRSSDAYRICISHTISSPSPSESELDAYEDTFRARLVDQLGLDLYTVCSQKDVAKVQALAPQAKRARLQDNINAICAAIDKWAMPLVTTVYDGARSVAHHCMEHPNRNVILDTVLRFVIFTEGADAAYRLLVELDYADVNFQLDRTGVFSALLRALGGTASIS